MNYSAIKQASNRESASVDSVELDELDLRILKQLQSDSAQSNQALAERVFASPPTCLRRVRRLYDMGVIEKQVALLNPALLGHHLTAIVEVSLKNQDAEAFSAFEALVQKETAVLQCYRVSGGADFVMVLQVQDMATYHALVGRFLTSKNNVRNIRTFFSMHRSKFETKVLPE
ncbi:Lrp/AsnC family transcriptional regulator [Brackiella oedipodis]|uniref:Lrp/AsnC family transcriptional regulator n=1 Tax=Brackiella oedipodis TaxID=124225 RepID=UPI0006860D05|nr:Lrp/AsnC family transcriptional regulator [Brackiella oedipodis]